MQQDFFNLINEFNKQAYDATRELTDINSRAFSRFADKQIELVNVYFDGAVKQAELARDAKDTGSYFKEQAELTKQYGEKVVNTVRKSVDVLNQARDEYAQWTEKSVNEASANLNKVQEEVTTNLNRVQEKAQDEVKKATRKAA